MTCFPELEWKSLRSVQKLQEVLRRHSTGVEPAAASAESPVRAGGTVVTTVDDDDAVVGNDDAGDTVFVDDDEGAGAGGDATASTATGGGATAVSTDAQTVSAGTASEEWRLDSGFPQRAAYCICKKAKETFESDDMVTCSSEDCQGRAGRDSVNWFHYACVKFNPKSSFALRHARRSF